MSRKLTSGLKPGFQHNASNIWTFSGQSAKKHGAQKSGTGRDIKSVIKPVCYGQMSSKLQLAGSLITSRPYGRLLAIERRTTCDRASSEIDRHVPMGGRLTNREKTSD
jgi:hypothetical protein